MDTTKMQQAEGLTFEPDGSSEQGNCPDCGNTTMTVWGYVHRAGAAHAAYYARWTKGHLERGMQLLVSVGSWGEGTTGKMRCCFGVECRMMSDSPGFMLVDADSMPWLNYDMLGKPLSRTQALDHPSKVDVFAILDALVEKDERINCFLFSRTD
ncbi:MAG: hypothetical protein HY711_05335 [Candidatus Melainabacteria bacterium]|nr:hypothetical protein [Candidatus Melainabacteria bacterium]